MMLEGCDGLVKLAGEVTLPGMAPIDGVEQLRFHGMSSNSGEVLAMILCVTQREKGYM